MSATLPSIRFRHRDRKRSIVAKRSRVARRNGITLIEVLVSALIVGALLVPTLRVMASVASSYARGADRNRAELLAESLLAEIMKTDFADQDLTLQTFGLESGEGTADRLDYDDIDDFHGLDEQPPLDRIGQVIPGCNDFRRQVVVSYVQPANPTILSAARTRLLKIQVTVSLPRQEDAVVESFVSDFEMDRTVVKDHLKNVTMQLQFDGQTQITTGTAKIQNELDTP